MLERDRSLTFKKHPQPYTNPATDLKMNFFSISSTFFLYYIPYLVVQVQMYIWIQGYITNPKNIQQFYSRSSEEEKKLNGLP